MPKTLGEYKGRDHLYGGYKNMALSSKEAAF